MRKKRFVPAEPLVRPTGTSKSTIYLHRRAIVAFTLILLLVGSGMLGFLLGRGQDADAASAPAPAGQSGIAAELAKQDNRCAIVEQINLQQELAAAQQEADQLVESLSRQQDEIARQQDEMEQLEETILDALMANLTEKTISRSGPTVASYAEKAKDLLALSRKVKSFEKTPEASEIDLTDYKTAISRQLANIPTLKPIPGNLNGYGTRIHPIYRYRHFHPAVDMGAPTGTPIKAAGGGTILSAGYNSSAGRFVKINHGNGFITAYFHCSKLYVQVGDRVAKGDVIAAVGNTGTSTTPHLHFEVTFYGSPVNPKNIIME
ncbi:MAG: peptidoglycan DD-metalloendopeptidase family protein [Clostridiaceae bacterium]|jgi:murein DD-endopeptidase MepM/ murein hydrolase activator NlpD|nr:peptidoglycan DD-metalloendopeptidase family protein [Clostridiaceae bacterium]